MGARRTYGTGSLYIKDGDWYGRWRSGDGRRRARKLGPSGRGGLGRKQAEERLREAMLADVSTSPVGAASLAELAPCLIADLSRHGRKHSHIRTVRSRLDAHILPALGNLAPGELAADDVRRLIDRMHNRGASPKTIRNTVGVLHSLLRLAQSRGMCERNAAEQVALPEPRRDHTLRYLTMSELERALAAAPPRDAPQLEHDWWRVIRLLALTAAMTGLRLGELRALRWRDLDMAALRVRVHRAIVDGRLTTPKSRSSERSVPLASRLVAELEQHHRQSPYNADDDLVFAHPHTGRVLDDTRLRRRWRAALERADVRPVGLHGLRHTFATTVAASGEASLRTLLVMTALQERWVVPLPMAVGLARLHRLLSKSSLENQDELLTGGEVAWFREARANPQRESDYWVQRDFSAGVPKVKARVHMITGWRDSFTPWQLEDYAALQQADRPCQLVIGPWTHNDEGLAAAGVREELAWLRGNLLGDSRLIDPAPVRLFVTGDHSAWREFDRWPPNGYPERRLWIADEQGLVWQPPAASGGRRYRYDPADPTPSVGGPIMVTLRPVQDNRRLEARTDVVTFTGPPLEATLEAIGPVRVELWARASEPYFDLFARLCDVDARGSLWNVCDALASVAPGRFEYFEKDDVWRVSFDLWPMAHRFAPGHRIRLQVSSGAHPRYVRNPGTGEDPLTATALRAVNVEILYGPQRPSALALPLLADGMPEGAV